MFLDDSYQRFDSRRYLGYGGFSLDADRIKVVTKGISDIKDKHGIPGNIDLKWSPPPDHYLRTTFKGRRHNLYADVLSLLRDNEAKILCAVHDIDSCYGIQLYKWDFAQIRLWATKQQCQFLAERFESLCLDNEPGIIIADHYSDIEGESSLIADLGMDFVKGTAYCAFDSLCIPPLTAMPHHCTPLQLADVVVGVIVSALIGNRYGLALFEDIAKQFVLDPHKDATFFVSTLSGGVLGWGLKLFPPPFRTKGVQLFSQLDTRYKYTSDTGLILKDGI
jgi:hypothetical protein